MAKAVTKWVADDGRMFDSLTEAEMHEKVGALVCALENFNPMYPEDGYDLQAAAVWLLETFKMEPLKS